MAEGEFALVQEHSEVALVRPSQGWASVGDHDLYSLLVDAAAQQWNTETLIQYIPLAEESARRYDHKLYQAIALRARGVLHRLAGEYMEAQSNLNQALDIFNAMNTRYQIGRTLFELGELSTAEKNNYKARNFYAQASKEFETMKVTIEVIRIRGVLSKLM